MVVAMAETSRSDVYVMSGISMLSKTVVGAGVMADPITDTD